MTEGSPGANPALGVSLNYALGEGRSLVLQTYVAREEVGPGLNKLLDDLMKAVERQAAKFEIEALKKNLEANERQLLQTTEDLANHEANVQARWDASNRKGEYKATPQEEAGSKNFRTTQKRLSEEIAKIKDLIKEREQKIAA